MSYITVEHFWILRSIGKVKRFHTVTTHKEDTVASHSFNVATMCMIIEEGEPSSNLLMAALLHDGAECWIGDIPAPAKYGAIELGDIVNKLEREWLELKGLWIKLGKSEQVSLKCADTLELMAFCLEERRLGNEEIEPVYHTGYEYVKNTEDLPPTAKCIMGEIDDRWKRIFR